ncbi:MAG: tRNA lysidine(34) synthetase TilS [Acidobacteria bacterium]|nr:tRNA lysidine(34) synthetase TilS [Acidobacteriota bacterium]
MPQGKDVYSRWSQEVRRSGLVRAGERVGVAVSGGADSVLLLTFMKQLAPAMGLVISVVHFNHHLRGAESNEDERFVSNLAGRLGVEFLRGDGDVARRAREQKRNVEATAREMRYRFFSSLVRAGRLDKIATAHTANDQAETVLLRLLRGTGTQGLGGIYPVLDGMIIRPFLGLTRAEVEAELGRRGLAYRVDSSNLELRYRRNRIRHALLPQLERDFNPDIVLALASLADRARADEEYLVQQAHDRAAPWRVREADEERFPVRVLGELPRALAFRVIRKMILASKGRLAGMTHRHLEAVYRLATETQSGRRTILPGNLEARREFDWLIVGPQPALVEGKEYAFKFQPPADIELPHIGIVLQFKIVEGEAVQGAYNEGGCVCLDAGGLAGELELRNWHAGDRWEALAGRKSLKLKELFRRLKIGAETRRLWPVLVSNGQIVWVRGMPFAGRAAPGKNTRMLLVIREEPLKTPVIRKRLR